MSGTTSFFRLRPLKRNVKMTRCRLQGGDGEVGMARWRLESRERLPSWKMLGAGEAAWVEEAGGEGKAAREEEAGPGRGC